MNIDCASCSINVIWFVGFYFSLWSVIAKCGQRIGYIGYVMEKCSYQIGVSSYVPDAGTDDASLE